MGEWIGTLQSETLSNYQLPIVPGTPTGMLLQLGLLVVEHLRTPPLPYSFSSFSLSPL